MHFKSGQERVGRFSKRGRQQRQVTTSDISDISSVIQRQFCSHQKVEEECVE